MWLAASPRPADVHAGFRGRFVVSEPATVEVRVLAVHWYRAFLDGSQIGEGPARFPRSDPEYSAWTAELAAGEHVVALHVHHYGVMTRMLPDVEPFAWCEVVIAGQRDPLPLTWRAGPLPGFVATGRRVSPLYGWIEWCDTRALPDWHHDDFDDREWPEPATAEPDIGPLRRLAMAEVQHRTVEPTLMGSGRLVETMGYYELDDPPARFLTRDLAPRGDADGVWLRYDLGRVHLGVVQVDVDVPAGTVVEIGVADWLTNDRVAPYFPSSTGATCTVDHFVARGGPQRLEPHTPKGARYIEVHLLGKPSEVLVEAVAFRERRWFGDPIGRFSCDAPLLEQIWAVSIDTLIACSEDALVDTPTRERGQWTGDVAPIGLEIAATAYDDLSVIRRGLVHAAACANADGFVAALSPGHAAYLSTYSMQWFSGCWRYFVRSGDTALLASLLPAAARNAEALAPHLGPERVRTDRLPGIFVDWGHAPRPSVELDMGFNLHALLGLDDLARWATLVDAPTAAALAGELSGGVRRAVADWLATTLGEHPDEAAWDAVGYHCTVLALAAGCLNPSLEAGAVAFIERHLLRSFPNNPAAPRHVHPVAPARPEAFYTSAGTTIITPYFSHYVMPELIARGEIDFVLGQWMRCWGWMLDRGATTWFEVFDHRWSQCHQWAGAPAWQLTRYVLGLQTRFDLGHRHVLLDPHPGWLRRASGAVPIPGGSPAQLSWERDGSVLEMRLDTAEPLTVHLPGSPASLEVSGEWATELALP